MTTRYALLSELDSWISQSGYDFLLDEDADGTVESDEQSTYGSTSLDYASNLIDGYICEQVDINAARAQVAAATSHWLKDRCIDIAVWRIAGIGGRDIPDAIQQAYDNTIVMLEGVKGGNQIPGYNYGGLVNAPYLQKRPVVANLCRKE